MSGVAGGASKKSSSRTMATKKLIIDEFKRRLRDNIKSLNDNFFHIIQAAKVNPDDNAYKNQTGKMTEFYTTKNEMAVRAQLMVRASDELLKLTADLKEFLILHDFHFLTHNIKQAEAQCEETLRQQSHQHNCLDSEVSNILFDLEREIAENFYLRHT
ncbi:Mediator of RNA polymerase II transcription subunit 22 [Caenorhabditis elegans]|uniref:Mediator of RNA polymerase II transcription subunit 22 n=1 Tax=Caenorhabditis elegans TaxID=6239 RepID=MED22_CAEEL|nr:Mediator of RNA polymerase II transcription subunit 22 [Caenorhabditis elegans]Q23679.1 RecName: Full=Mediator of RNA polymerase II transcription subunit 22; AltName: Full=Mediator complex subunit 22 [Caenorhabditis elegans]CAA88887.1 Mediator of RNA polymerase II transcription subunit 22 [Caenorhabditis elegans]|eukprot:NP_496216.1 Mediator of RNA polymerase II transcription subunit 22 [Caenorhabditis elegans]